MSENDGKPSGISSLRSINAKVAVFALLATLIPSVVLSLLHYQNNERLLEDKISQGLQMTTDGLARNISQWLEDRRDELSVFGTTYLVLENLQPAMNGDVGAQSEIVTYLHSVLRRSPNLGGLAIIDRSGQLIVSTDTMNWGLPDGWRDAGSLDDLPMQHLVDDVGSSLLVGVQLTGYDGEMVGFLAGRVHLRQVADLLSRTAASTGEAVYLIDDAAAVIVNSDDQHEQGSRQVGMELLQRMRQGEMVNHWHEDGTQVVARVSALNSSNWFAMAERQADEAYADITSLQRLTVIITLSLMVVMGFLAYLFSTRTLAPLKRLTAGASRVAAGELDVRVKVRGNDEIAYLTRVFNDMVERVEVGRRQVEKAADKLRAQNRSLQVLSNTDPLTGLYNRQHLSARLERLVEASERARLPFAILMLDLDRFKALNDKYGHVAGDRAIKLIAEHIRDTLRKSDYAARYGGEEFVVLLPKVDGARALELAERLRLAVASTPLRFDEHELHVTTSIGVAAFPEHGRESELLIRRADEALYDAKAKGRNATVLARGPDLKVIPAEADQSG
ncbi:MAG: diguanylate cyclase [Pseudomonadota bacterium]